MDEIFKFVLAALAIFAFGIGMLLLVYFTTKKRRYIKKYGIKVDAEIIGHRSFYNPVYNNNGDRINSVSYYISCKYITKNNEEITKEYRDVSFGKLYVRRHPIGSKIKISYLPEEPRQSIIMNSSLQIGFIIMEIIGFALLGFSLFVLYSGIMNVYFS